MVHFLYEEYVEDLPEIFEKFSWARSLIFPVELYLPFPNKKKYTRFMKALKNETTATIIACY